MPGCITGNSFYLRTMIKKLLFILPLFFLFLLNQNTKSDTGKIIFPIQKDVVFENIANKGTQNTLQNEELNQFRNFVFCTPGRNIQPSYENSERLFKITSRQFELFLKIGQNRLIRVSEILSVTYLLHCSSLRIRSGHWVYVLRKIII